MRAPKEHFVEKYEENGCYICKSNNKQHGTWLVLGGHLTCIDCQKKQLLEDERIDKVKEVAGLKGRAWEVLQMYDYNYFIQGVFISPINYIDSLYYFYNKDNLQISIIDRYNLAPGYQFGEYKCQIRGHRRHIDKDDYISFGTCSCPHDIVIISNPDIDPLPSMQFSLCHCDWISLEAE